MNFYQQKEIAPKNDNIYEKFKTRDLEIFKNILKMKYEDILTVYLNISLFISFLACSPLIQKFENSSWISMKCDEIKNEDYALLCQRSDIWKIDRPNSKTKNNSQLSLYIVDIHYNMFTLQKNNVWCSINDWRISSS